MAKTDYSICNSCHTMVATPDEGDTCTRCGQSMNPSALEQLRQFAEHGVQPHYGGVPIPVAQRAATLVLGEYDELKFRMDGLEK